MIDEGQSAERPRRNRYRRRNRGFGHAPATSLNQVGLRALKDIDIGEPDANAEYFMARRSQETPMFLRAYYEGDSGINEELTSGRKFLLYGQKGTGKTAILRHLEHKSKDNYSTEFVVFRKEIVEEAQLANLASTFSASVVVDEDKIKESLFYYHAMKRLLLTLILSKGALKDDEIPEDASWFKKIYAEIRNSSVGQVASLVTDSVVGSLEAVNIDIGKATKGIASVNPSMAIKRSNDAFQKFAFSQFEKKRLKLVFSSMKCTLPIETSKAWALMPRLCETQF